MIAAAEGDPLGPLTAALIKLAEHQEQAGLHYFSGVSWHNAACTNIIVGDYEAARKHADRAINEFDLATSDARYAPSTMAARAIASFQLGDFDTALREVQGLLAAGDRTTMDALADCATISCATGSVHDAQEFLERIVEDGAGEPELGVHALVGYAKSMWFLSTGRLTDADVALPTTPPASGDPDSRVRWFAIRGLVSLLLGQDEAIQMANQGAELAQRQGAKSWERWLEMIKAIARGDDIAARRLVSILAVQAPLTLLCLADAIVSRIELFEPLPSAVEASITRWPGRWLPALRRRVVSGDRSAEAAALVLARFGEMTDVVLLSQYERRGRSLSKDRSPAARLARRVSGTLLIHDLGRTVFTVGGREVRLSQTRRKAAALLVYLASRAKQTAAREQVLEDLWPDAAPRAASNSLHQTLFFLRRSIDPGYEEAWSADYVAMESEILYLDPDLVQVDSVAFFRQACEAITQPTSIRQGVALIKEYPGPFAPEFEYEEWAMSWRDRVHATYLQLAQATADFALGEGQPRVATELLSRALVVDSHAFELEASLVCALVAAGARAAALEQYEHYAHAYRRDLGAEPPSLSDLLASVPHPPT
jgi:DNA-binding SARP family transcriptional activator